MMTGFCKRAEKGVAQEAFGPSNEGKGRSRGGSRGWRLGRSPTLKPTKVTLFTIILYNWENNIRWT